MISEKRKIWFEAMKLPVTVTAAASAVLSCGYALCPAVLQGGKILGTANRLGRILYQAGGLFYYHMDIVLCVGLVYGLCKKDRYALFSAAFSMFCAQLILNPVNAGRIFPVICENSLRASAFSFYPQPFTGILCALMIWTIFQKKKRAGGFLVSSAACICVLMLWALLYPFLFELSFKAGMFFADRGGAGAVLYTMSDRMLSLTGLNQGMFQAVMKDTWGKGEMTAFFALRTQAETDWPLGAYMSGCMPMVTAGIPYSLYVLYQKRGRSENAVLFILLAAASMTGGLTEGIELLLASCSCRMFAVYILLYGCTAVLTLWSGFRAGYALHGGLADFFFSAPMPAAQKLYMILFLSISAVVLCRTVFCTRKILCWKSNKNSERFKDL